MIKGKATLTFKFYEDISGMQMYVSQPSEAEEDEFFFEDNQEELELNPEDTPEEQTEGNAEDENEEEVEEASTEESDEETTEEEVEEPEQDEPEKPANTGDPLVLTPYRQGLSTGTTMEITFDISKDMMKSLLDAEARGLAPCFSLSIK